MKQIIRSVIFFVSAVFGVGYFVALQIAAPESFSFSAVWLLAGVICLVLFIIDVTRGLRPIHMSVYLRRVMRLLFIALVCAVATTLFFILTPCVVPQNVAVPYVIVLGGGIDRNGHLSDVPIQRLKTAAAYLNVTPGATVVVSGGKTYFAPCSEAPELARVLVSFGVDATRVIQEGQARDTIENFTYSAQLIAQHSGVSLEKALQLPIVVVTSDFHLARAERIAHRCGFSCVYGLSSRTSVLYVLNAYCREILAYVKLNLRILLTGEPNSIVVK